MSPLPRMKLEVPISVRQEHSSKRFEWVEKVPSSRVWLKASPSKKWDPGIGRIYNQKKRGNSEFLAQRKCKPNFITKFKQSSKPPTLPNNRERYQIHSARGISHTNINLQKQHDKMQLTFRLITDYFAKSRPLTSGCIWPKRTYIGQHFNSKVKCFISHLFGTFEEDFRHLLVIFIAFSNERSVNDLRLSGSIHGSTAAWNLTYTISIHWFGPEVLNLSCKQTCYRIISWVLTRPYSAVEKRPGIASSQTACSVVSVWAHKTPESIVHNTRFNPQGNSHEIRTSITIP